MRILFISNSASRSGAPIALLNFLKWLRKHTLHQFAVVLAKDGDLRCEFAKVAKTVVYGDIMPGVRRGLLGRFLRKIGVAYKSDYSRSRLVDLFPPGSVDLIFSNTIVNGGLVNELAYLSVPVVTHVHELEGVIETHGKQNLIYNLEYSKQFMAVSDAVRNNLVVRHGVSPDRVIKISGCSDLSNIDSIRRRQYKFRQSIGVPANAMVVGGVGSGVWQKGKDLFMQVAINLRSRRMFDNLVFLWVGGDSSDNDQLLFSVDVKRVGFGDAFKLINKVECQQTFN